MTDINKVHKLFTKLINSSLVKFPQKGKVEITIEHGVYIIYSPKKLVLHVGKTHRGKNGLKQRLQNHINNSSSFSKQYLNKKGKVLREGYKYKFIIVKDPRLRTFLEALTTGMLCPAYIGTGEKRID